MFKSTKLWVLGSVLLIALTACGTTSSHDAMSGMDLRQPLRRGATAEDMREIIRNDWGTRRDRGAEDRKGLEQVGLRNGGLIGIDQLREDPHLEMHARGG